MPRSPIALPVYFRAFPIPQSAPKPLAKLTKRPDTVLILDVETTIDTEQRLTFGGYQLCRWRPDGTLRVLEHGLFYDQGRWALSPDQVCVIDHWIAARIEATGGRGPKYRYWSRAEFVHDILLKAAGSADGPLIVGLNLPFDLARLADDFMVARRGRMSGGFSLELPPRPRHGSRTLWLPRIRIKVIGERRAFIDLSAKGRKRGRWLDLRMLMSALTGESFSLDRAAAHYGIEYRKPEGVTHGVVTPDYLDYHANDLDMTRLVCERACADLARHPIGLAPESAFSSASVGRRYLHAMHILPPLGRLLPIDDPIHGIAMEAYVGGRAECHIRRVPVPIMLVDFRSEYPTINVLMRLWPLLTAKRVRVEGCADEARAILAQVSHARLLDPTFWPQLGFFAKVQSADDLLPVRACYPGTSTPGIGLNHLTLGQAHWVAGPDLAAAVLLTGKQPEILDAVRQVVVAPGDELCSVLFEGTIPLYPTRSDFVAALVEERERLKDEAGNEALRTGLKLLANATAYGIGVQFDPRVPEKKEPRGRVLFGTTRAVLPVGVAEDAGPYCAPYSAALTTAGGRLLLALLEHGVTRRGGTWAMCDTDSMAIVAGAVRSTLKVAGEPVTVLGQEDVDAIVGEFAALNPFRGSLQGASILKIEHDTAGEQNFIYAISAKRYAMFRLDTRGQVVIVKASEHGLGAITPPMDRAAWVQDVWTYGIARALGRQLPEPAWWHAPAVMRLTITQPSLAPPKAFTLRYLRPLSFVLTPFVAPGGHVGGAAESIRLVHRYMDVLPPLHRLRWLDLHTGKTCRATTIGDPGPGVVRIKSLGEVVLEHLVKPEAKSCGPDGNPCTRKTVGVLRRMHVHGTRIVYTGKEVSGRELSAEEPDGGVAVVFGEVGQVAATGLRARLQALPSLKAFAKGSGIPLRTLQRIRNDGQVPHAAMRHQLERALDRVDRGDSVSAAPSRPARRPLVVRPRHTGRRASRSEAAAASPRTRSGGGGRKGKDRP